MSPSLKEQVFSAREEARSFKEGQRLIRFLGVVEAQKVPCGCGAPEGSRESWRPRRFLVLWKPRRYLETAEIQMVSHSSGGPDGFF